MNCIRKKNMELSSNEKCPVTRVIVSMPGKATICLVEKHWEEKSGIN